MEWLEPWRTTEIYEADFHEAFRKQLEREVTMGHPMYGLPVKLIARGDGDDALFQILDGSGRVAEVHLTWTRVQRNLSWPLTTIYPNLEDSARESMRREHEE